MSLLLLLPPTRRPTNNGQRKGQVTQEISMLFLSFFFLFHARCSRAPTGKRMDHVGGSFAWAIFGDIQVKPSLYLPIPTLSIQPAKKEIPANNGEHYAAAP